jgi:hypothetical protein
MLFTSLGGVFLLFLYFFFHPALSFCHPHRTRSQIHVGGGCVCLCVCLGSALQDRTVYGIQPNAKPYTAIYRFCISIADSGANRYMLFLFLLGCGVNMSLQFISEHDNIYFDNMASTPYGLGLSIVFFGRFRDLN